MSRKVDLRRAETTPFAASEGHRELFALAGVWEGPTRTWLDPSAEPDESVTTARIEPILGGRFLRLDYEGKVRGAPHAGEMLIGYSPDENLFSAAWVDSFHMSSAIMLSTGLRRADGVISVLGSYAAAGERWGWRTVFKPLDDEHLTIEAYNISPAGREERGVETLLSRTER